MPPSLVMTGQRGRCYLRDHHSSARTYVCTASPEVPDLEREVENGFSFLQGPQLIELLQMRGCAALPEITEHRLLALAAKRRSP